VREREKVGESVCVRERERKSEGGREGAGIFKSVNECERVVADGVKVVVCGRGRGREVFCSTIAGNTFIKSKLVTFFCIQTNDVTGVVVLGKINVSFALESNSDLFQPNCNVYFNADCNNKFKMGLDADSLFYFLRSNIQFKDHQDLFQKFRDIKMSTNTNLSLLKAEKFVLMKMEFIGFSVTDMP
jgi:hypothetical protein